MFDPPTLLSLSPLLPKLKAVLGPSGLLMGEQVEARGGGWDGKSIGEAHVLARPACTSEAAEVLRLCHAYGQPVVPVGGMTGLVHGAKGGANEILLSTERMTRILSVDPTSRTMHVEAGAKLQTVQQAARERGLLFAVDLGSRGSCTIGGNIATNAGGHQVLRYGMMREQVLGLEAVLPDGAIIRSMNTLPKNNAGYDLKQLFIGSEGTLGLITQAVLRLHDLPASENTALLGISSFGALVAFYRYVREQLGGTLSAFEVLWREHYELLCERTKRHAPPLPPGCSHYVLVEAHGLDAEHDERRFADVLERALEQGLVEDAAVAQSITQRNAFWAIREDIGGLVDAIFPAGAFDVSLPIDCMNDYVIALQEGVAHRWGASAQVIVFGHLADGNLHILVSPGSWGEDIRSEVERLVYLPLQKVGGSISAEHGIGLEKRAYLSLSRSPSEIALMRRLKAALDPADLLNRAKVLPEQAKPAALSSAR